MLNITDFKRGDNRYTDYIAEITLWGEKIKLDVFFEEQNNRENTCGRAARD